MQLRQHIYCVKVTFLFLQCIFDIQSDEVAALKKRISELEEILKMKNE